VTYGYDSNSNVITRTSPAPNQTSCATTVTITYSYDALNRLTGKTYSDSSPAVKYGYDAVALSGCTTTPPALTDSNPKGRMTSMCDSSGATSWTHDALGKILTEKRTILGATETTSYVYNLDGSAATVTYPSGKTVTYTVSNAQRLTSAKDTTSGTQFAITASYAAPGGLQGMITGQISGGFGGVTESHTFNNSLEYTSTKATSTVGTAMDLSLAYSLTGGDNGTATKITNNADNGRTQTLGYDPLNRISTATTQATSGVDCWGESFGPDALANLNSIGATQCSPPGTLSVTVDANNHINSGTSYAYDALGNMTKDGSGTIYTFDDENRLILATGPSGGPYCYVYDGNGLRVAKKSSATSCASGTVTKLYWRSTSGDALAETDPTGATNNSAYNEYIFFAGRRIASRTGAATGTGPIFYYFADQLGTTRTITTGNGTGQTPGQLCYDADFTPYGQEIQYSARLQTTACPPNYRFTGYEFDSETGLNYAFARFYSPRLGRFLSTDPLIGSIGSLQSHNAYAYTRNNPLNATDPSGAFLVFINSDDGDGGGGGFDPGAADPCFFYGLNCPSQGPIFPPGVPGGGGWGRVSALAPLRQPPAPVGYQQCIEAALRDMVAHDEGTAGQPDGGYGTLVAGDVEIAPGEPWIEGQTYSSRHPWNMSAKDLAGLNSHPYILVDAGVSESTAFGRYQFNVATWNQFGSGGMTPAAQDLAMNNLMGSLGMTADAMGGQIVQAIWDGNKRWASLPDSPYNQNSKSWAETIAAFQNALNNLPECQ
jgi:RHS repeat-associated protein